MSTTIPVNHLATDDTIQRNDLSATPERHAMISMAAYFIAEKRGFEAGHEFDDWLAAEAAIDALTEAAL